jgi:plastocyanin
VDGKYSPSVTPSITYRGLPPGKHKLEVYLANNDHSNTGVEAATQFTIKGAKSASGGQSAPAGKKASAGKSASGGKTIAVMMKNIQFAPKALTAKVGETIKWTNADSVDHNVTATKGETFKSKAFGKGGTFSYKLDKPGALTYVCTLHPGMKATITVTK